MPLVLLPTKCMVIWHNSNSHFLHLLQKFDSNGHKYKCSKSTTESTKEAVNYGTGRICDWLQTDCLVSEIPALQIKNFPYRQYVHYGYILHAMHIRSIIIPNCHSWTIRISSFHCCCFQGFCTVDWQQEGLATSSNLACSENKFHWSRRYVRMQHDT